MTYPYTVQCSPARETADDDILRAAATGDVEAFGVIYRQHAPQVYRYLLTRTASPEDAADITQQTFLRAFRNISSYRPHRDGFAPWLLRIARNGAIDSQRRRRDGVQIQPFDERMAAGVAASPEAAMLRAERISELRALINQLDHNAQDILALRFAGELSVTQIAVVLGKSEAAVRKQLWRAIKMLKELGHENEFSA